MKCLLPLLMLTSCGSYYVGRKPVDLKEELVAQVPVVVAAPVEKPQPKTEAAPAEAKPLVGWDGKAVQPDDRPLHGVDTGEGGHSSLLSMYMDTKEEADLLRLELQSLSAMLDKQNQLISQHDAIVAGKDQEIVRLEMDLISSKAAREDLEARLVTAQIRRLEAEKQLLLNILGVEDAPPAEVTPPPTVAATKE
jgi:hypothetical protein